jgi:hypothetical protein
MVDVKAKMEKEKAFTTFRTKEAQHRLETRVKELTGDLYQKIDELQESEQQCKRMVLEREKMKQRIIKLKSRKGKVDQGIKVCKTCGKEYHEKENFNWSCRTHRYEYSGEMWWCCGKRGSDVQGCRFAKHESKDDEDDDEDNDREKNKAKQLKNIRCHCCKELGHNIDDCPRDPNIKTGPEAQEELDRI